MAVSLFTEENNYNNPAKFHRRASATVFGGNVKTNAEFWFAIAGPALSDLKESSRINHWIHCITVMSTFNLFH